MKWYGVVGIILLIYLFTIGLFQFWFRMPLAIAEDPLFGLGQLTGLIATTWFSIWLIKKSLKRKQSNE